LDKINHDELSRLMNRLNKKAELASEEAMQDKLEMRQGNPETPDMFLESVRQTLGIEGRVIRVFKRKANAPIREAKSKGWLFKEIMKDGSKFL
jgi:hypothetical protein